MAENPMVKEQLTEGMIEAGGTLTRKLDELGVPISAAFWLFESETNEWRLLFASPEVASRGPREVYEKIRQAIDQIGSRGADAPLSAISLMDADSELVRLLRVAIRTGPGVSQIRFSKNVINGRFVEDALIYRVT